MFDQKSILITGGTGTFGQQLVRRLLRDFSPKKIVIFSRDELKQHEMSQEFPRRKFECMRYCLGDIRDKERLMTAFRNIDIVFHAAALKHVTAAEYNPIEFVKTNILGTQNIIDVAIERGVKKVIAISTDKACNPVNLYGATKLCADKLFVAGNSLPGEVDTRFSVVRFGNLMGSRGSLLPSLLQQRASGSVFLTDLRMTRFWITPDQCVDFAIRVTREMIGGEIFVPKIPSMRLVDLVEAIAPNCQIVVTGIRPGEKLHEILLNKEEALNTLEYPEYFRIQPPILSWSEPPNAEQGIRVQETFDYTSDENTDWLSVEELKELLACEPGPPPPGWPNLPIIAP